MHEDDIAAVGIGNDDAPIDIKKGRVALDLKSFPTGIDEELLNLLIGSRSACNGWLTNHEPETELGLQCSEKSDLIPKQFIVKLPSLQIRNGR